MDRRGEFEMMPIIFFIIIVVAYLFCLCPNKYCKGKMEPFKKFYIAHRGYFDNNGLIPENSLAAFRNAINAHYGIELDVQSTSDENVVVFHDDSLDRMCGINKIISDCTYEELKIYKLMNSDEHIPLFEDVIQLVDGQVPIIIEIKSGENWKKTTNAIIKIMEGYKGLYCVESFDPFVLYMVKKRLPNIPRGQLSTDYFKDHLPKSFVCKFLLTNLLLNLISKPDFIAYNFLRADQLSFRIFRRLFANDLIAWTIKSQEQLEIAKRHFSIFIFEGFVPN